MKRTAEVILGIIGALIYGFFAIIGGVMIWFENNQEAFEEIYQDMVAQSPEMEFPDYQTFIDSMGSGGVFLLIVSLAAVIAGIVAMVFLKGNKRPKAAGIIFILAAVAVALLQVGVGIFVGVFYIIAGIMALVRKPKQEIAEF